VIRQSPIYAYHDRTHDFSPCKLSDFLTLRRLRGLDVYTDFFRPAGIEYRLAVGLPAPLTHTKCFLFDRRRGDFDDRDRAVLDVLLPHLTALYAAAKARRVAAAVATGDRAAGELVVLSPSGAIDFRTATAGELLTRYFPDEHDGRLPEAVDSWRRQQTARLNGDGPLPDPAEPLTVRRDGTRLVIRRLGHTLLLSEETAALTRREREIMEQLGDGQSNAEIASRLCIAPSTVRKHLENIYAKLGVRTRTAAVARVRRG
jgi:DNA-binding CsgD family transcriptional regulator